MTIGDFLSRVSTSVQILFFLATGWVAVLSYVTAKKTLFQPLRTEIFKKQIEDLSLILGLFSGKGEVQLREEFAFDELIIANIAKMYDTYAAFAFDVVRPEEIWEYRHELCPVSIVRPEALELATSYRIDDIPEKLIKPKEWEYKGYDISLPRAFSAKEDDIKRILDSPLLPISVAEMLERYLAVVYNNAQIIQDAIIECANEMPLKYPKLDDLKKASPIWIENRIRSNFSHLVPVAKEINDYVRNYFDSDNLLPSNHKSNWMIRYVRAIIKRINPSRW